LSGYGSPDDEQERAQIRVDEQIKLSQSMLPSGPGSPVCLECYQTIPLARRKALPGVVRCVTCQSLQDCNTHVKFREPWST
jgi:phage/conjugal plasmid C-4 type zinc finger TraR family protein